MIGSVCGASVALLAVYMHLKSLRNHEADALAGDTFDVNIYISWAGMFFAFTCFQASLAGLTGLNLGVLPSKSSWYLGSGLTISLQNFIGYSMGPFLPGLLTDHLGLNLGDAYENA